MKKKLVAVAAAAVAMVPLMGSPASAGTGAGELAFECVASLPAFPSGGASGTCGSGELASGVNVQSSAEGTIQGLTDDEDPFVLAAAGLNNFSATFNYREGCVAGEPPVLGDADGSATITGLTGVILNDGPTVTNVTNGTLRVNFTWTRGGATAAITITGATLSFGTGVSESVTGNVLGAGTAAFAPLVGLGNTCPTGVGLKALVGGTAAVTFTE